MYSASHNTTIPTSEIELGLEYGRPFRGRYMFLRAAAVDQTYFGLGSASSNTGNLSLIGSQISVGLNF